MRRRCPACDLASLVHTADLGVVPALCGVTWDDQAAAIASARGEIRLWHCPRCGHTVNVGFQPELIAYDGEYDNSLHHSPTFQQYATQLAKRLAADYDLAGRTILEPGCGKGDFLVELCAVAGAAGLGYDASYEGPERVDRVRFVRGFLTPGDQPRAAAAPDFIVSRHVLEHLADPYDFLVDLRRVADDRSVCGYVEVPNASYDFATAGWDCIYPHVSYFNADSLTRMLRRAGFEVLEVGTAFDDIFLWVEVAANPSGSRPVDRTARDDVAASQLARLSSFGQRYLDTVAGWRTTIAELSDAGAPVVLWGAGARGVAFLNAADQGHRLAGVLDLNPGKWGRYLPVTGHRVCSPEEVLEIQPAVVVITNPAYRGEIAGTLARLGVEAEVRVA